MVKNILFDEKKQKVKASEFTPPLDPKSGRPMQKVIIGSYNKKKTYAWFGKDSHLVLPIFKNNQ